MGHRAHAASRHRLRPHTWATCASQRDPQESQWDASLDGSTHAAPQARLPAGQAQVPAEQATAGGHWTPQAPQFMASVAGFTHLPLHAVSVQAFSAMQRPSVAHRYLGPHCPPALQSVPLKSPTQLPQAAKASASTVTPRRQSRAWAALKRSPRRQGGGSPGSPAVPMRRDPRRAKGEGTPARRLRRPGRPHRIRPPRPAR